MAAARSGSRRVFLIAFQREYRLQSGWSLSSGLTPEAMSGRNCRIPSGLGLCRITGVSSRDRCNTGLIGEQLCRRSGGPRMARFSPEDRRTIWDMREAGVPVKRIARHLGRQNSSLRRFIADAGGRRPTPRERSELRLTLAKREEISPRPGGRMVDPSDRRRTGPSALNGVPRGQRQRRLSALSGPPRRSSGGPASAATQAHQAGSLPSPAPGRRGQARGQLVTRADLFVVG